jgi:hypothetical protein
MSVPIVEDDEVDENRGDNVSVAQFHIPVLSSIELGWKPLLSNEPAFAVFWRRRENICHAMHRLYMARILRTYEDYGGDREKTEAFRKLFGGACRLRRRSLQCKIRLAIAGIFELGRLGRLDFRNLTVTLSQFEYCMVLIWEIDGRHVRKIANMVVYRPESDNPIKFSTYPREITVPTFFRTPWLTIDDVALPPL